MNYASVQYEWNNRNWNLRTRPWETASGESEEVMNSGAPPPSGGIFEMMDIHDQNEPHIGVIRESKSI